MTTQAASMPRERASRIALGDARGLLLAIGALLTVAGLGVAQAGYFPTAFGWSTLAFLVTTAVVLLLRGATRLSVLEGLLLAALLALAGWIGLSAAWSVDVSQTVVEIERTLVYVAGVTAAVVLATRSSATFLLGGVLTGITAVSAYALATRLFPERLGTFDPIAGYRLSEPLGYWNALGIFAAIGALLAVGFAARAARPSNRALAASSLVVLVPTMYFTFGRGPWLALAIALVAAIALDPRRLQFVTALLVLAPAPALAVWLASRSEALTREQAALEEATRDGRRLALAIVAIAITAAVAALVLARLESRLRVGRPIRLAYIATLALVVTGLLASVFFRYGGPATIVQEAYDAFKAPPPQVQGDLSKRLFSFSGSGRWDHWSVAWDNYEAHPWLGSGAGTFEQAWAQERPVAATVRDAHTLYLEMLAELGPIGLALLLLALGAPLVAAIQARRQPLVPAAFAAYVAYLVHAGVDWDWEMPAVTVAALFCGVAILVAARDEEKAWALSSRVRAAGITTVLVLSGFAFVGLVGNSALAASINSAASEDYDKAEAEARKAITWAPWSSEPWEALADAQVGQGKYSEASVSLRKALSKDERNWSLWLDLALLTEGEERSRALARASELNPLSTAVAAAREELE